MEFERAVKLLLAAQVREIAIELRKRAAHKEYKAKGAQSQTADAYTAQFVLTHPLTEFTPAAITELAEIEAIASATLNQ